MLGAPPTVGTDTGSALAASSESAAVDAATIGRLEAVVPEEVADDLVHLLVVGVGVAVLAFELCHSASVSAAVTATPNALQQSPVNP